MFGCAGNFNSLQTNLFTMISNSFAKGNYNSFVDLIRTKLPEIDNKVRNEIIPQIDEVLISMLGERSSIDKESLNYTQYCNKTLQGIYVDIAYTVKDWRVSDAPATAIEADEKSLSDFLIRDDIPLLDLKIDTTLGILSIKYFLSIED